MKSLSLALSAFVLSLGCGNVEVSGSGGSGGSDEQTMTSLPSGCQSTKYMLGDPVMYVCANPLPVTVASGLNPVQVVNVTFVNFHSVFNRIMHVCVTNVGKTPLDNQIVSLTFDVLNWDHEPVKVFGPWSADQRVCLDVPILIGEKNQRTLAVNVNPVWPFNGAVEYQFQITATTDIVLSDPIKIDGSFPVLGEVVKIKGG